MDPSDNTLISPQTQMRVRDSNFEISVYTWDEFTLDILRKYADWKCNNGSKISNENKINNIDNEINVKNNVKTEEATKQIQDDEILATYSSDYGSSVYKSVIDEILNNLGKSFSRNDVADIIFRKRNGEVTKTTCYVYSKDYITYLIKNKLIIEKGNKFYKIHTESETDWTASDEDYLRENFFLISFEKLCNGLNKSPEEIREKAIRFFGKKAVIERYGE